MKVATVLASAIMATGVGYGLYFVNTPNVCLRGPSQRALPRDPMRVGDTLRLRVGELDILHECDNAPPPVVHWRTSDSTVAAVDDSGRIIARGVGSALISVHARWASAAHSISVRE